FHYSCSPHHRPPHSFPTRRSSDLNPSSIDIDSRGRVWVCEGANYRVSPHMNKPWGVQRQGGDRILILEDTDGDGRADKETVFYRSEEHTSELQSLRHLVCRLLLEK